MIKGNKSKENIMTNFKWLFINVCISEKFDFLL